ncbi:ATP-dependent zinc protease family protein [Piscirickettsia litoralis]|uniref:ATP-dependent zinc protease n=1 Tax=Piscirickettsia litoralis TaxID=1891921 RepID=A0ABX3A647_9GAMM|nr:RimK/LysX family protein [Piscirickettsia litoralis]ODN44025.1 ATP-dependent zinc protease [Piscirickettsia litoralis]
MKQFTGKLSLVAGLFLMLSSLSAAKTIIGAVEHTKIPFIDEGIRTRIDSGAKVGAISGFDLKSFSKEGKDYISFTFESPKRHISHRFTLPVARYIHIKERRKQGSEKDSLARRPVIILPVCLGSEVERVELSILDRRNFMYPILLGRDAITKFNRLIDPAEKFATKPHCSKSELTL